MSNPLVSPYRSEELKIIRENMKWWREYLEQLKQEIDKEKAKKTKE